MEEYIEGYKNALEVFDKQLRTYLIINNEGRTHKDAINIINNIITFLHLELSKTNKLDTDVPEPEIEDEELEEVLKELFGIEDLKSGTIYVIKGGKH